MTTPSWYTNHLRRVFFDMHLPDWTRPGQSGGQLDNLRGVATAFDPQAIVAQFARARVNVIVAYAKCQYGNFYYNTQIGHKHTGLGDLDLLAELLHEAHRQNIRVIGYYSNMWDTEAARAHPDWMAQNAQGESSYDRWPTLCLNSPYRDLVHQHLREMFTRYDLDGMWSDILSALPCFCPRCEALYQQTFGEPMPRSPEVPHWIQMVRWQQDYLYGYIESSRLLVKSLKPDAAYIVNFFGTPYAAPSQGLTFKHLAQSDYGSTEGYSEWHGLLFPSYACRYMRAGTLDGPFEVLTSRFESTWDFTVRPLAQMRFEAFSVAANGGAVCVDDEPYHDGCVEPLVYDYLANIFGEIERREPYLLGAQPYHYAALYHSQKAREVDEVLNRPQPLSISGTSFFPASNPAPSDIIPTLMGAFKGLLEEHLPLEFVDDRLASLDTLARYRVVYLPNVLPMNADEAERLRQYVYNGGGLVATGATSLYDDQGQPRDNFLLADLFGVDFVRRGAYTFPFFAFEPGPLSEGLTGQPIPHDAAMWEVRLNTNDAIVVATRRDPLIETSGEVYYHNNKPAPGPRSGEPAIVCQEYGKGRVVYCAGLPENQYAIRGHVPYRQMIANMVRWAARAEPPVQVEGLRNTELVTARRGGDLIVHLVTGVPQRTVVFGLRRTLDTIEEYVPLYGVRLFIPPQTTEARRVPQNESLPIQRDQERAWIVIPRLEDWETILLTQAGH
ncbi:MAG: beta-galactosidase trimerization domain-containing protein [Anaerolineae bacterium]|nr:beta-galactosidase trimerization domain-containing protein [Anaerolineae bacterium]